MAEIRVKARMRKESGKGAARRLRAAGRVPGIVYGKGTEPVPIELDAKDVYFLTHGAHAASLESVIVSLEIGNGVEGGTRSTLIKEIQHDPVKGDVLHIDFHQISLTERIHARIPVLTVGESPGVGAGGILEHALRELEVVCRAMDLPEEVRLDISGLELGESLRVRDVDLGPEIEVLNDPDLSVVSVTVPRGLVEEVAEEEAAEPELVGEKEEEEETESREGKKAE